MFFKLPDMTDRQLTNEIEMCSRKLSVLFEQVAEGVHQYRLLVEEFKKREELDD